MVLEHYGRLREYLVVFTDMNPPKEYHPQEGVRWVNVLKFNEWRHYGTLHHGGTWIHYPIDERVRRTANRVRDIMGYGRVLPCPITR
jgi:hypothetical protein